MRELEGNGIRVVPQVLHYLNSQRNGWRYRLLGSRNEHWKHAAPDQLEVLYANLSPGTYRFQAVGYTGGGVESGPPQELAFRVLPPLWLRPWAIALEVLLFVGLAWALAGLRTRTLRSRATRMQAEIDTQTREISDQNQRLNQQAAELARLLDSQSDFYPSNATANATIVTTLPKSGVAEVDSTTSYPVYIYQTADNEAAGIDQHPLLLDFGRLGRISLHGIVSD